MLTRLAARLLVAIAAAALPAATIAADFYVDPIGGSDATGDGSPAAPWKTIGWAIDQGAGDGDHLWLAAGEFGPAGNGESFPLRVPSGLSLHGTRDASGPLTRIAYLMSGPIPEGMLFVPTGPDDPVNPWRVEDIAFDGGAMAGAGAIVLEMGGRTYPTIRRNTFTNSGSAIFQRYQSVLPVCLPFDARTRIEANVFTGNGTAVLINLVGTHTCNTALDHSAIVNNFMRSNSTGVSLTGSCSGCDPGELLFATQVWNNTIVDGEFGVWMYDGGCTSTDFMQPEIRNDVFASLGTGVHDECDLLPADRVGPNDYWNNGADGVTGPDSIFEDPLLVDVVAGDLHLQAGSPCIDRGRDAGAPLDDIDGDARPLDGDGDLVATTDIGADEFPASAAPPTLMRADLSALAPRTPDLSLIFPFAPTNPLTPVIRDPFASGDTDPTPGILSNDTIPLAIYAVDPEPTGDLLAVADTAGDTVRITIR